MHIYIYAHTTAIHPYITVQSSALTQSQSWVAMEAHETWLTVNNLPPMGAYLHKGGRHYGPERLAQVGGVPQIAGLRCQGLESSKVTQ